MRPIIKNIIQDTFWVVVLQGFNYLIPLFVWPYLIVVLGAEGFGVVGFSMAFIQFMMLIVDFGFNLSATKRIATAGSQEEIDRIASSTIIAKMILLAGSIVVSMLLLLLPQFAPYRIAVLCLLPMLCSSVITMQWLYQGLGKIRKLWVMNSICKLIIIPLTFVVVKGTKDVLIAVGIQSVAYFVSALVGFLWALRSGMFRFVSTAKQKIEHALSDSFPLFISTATSSVYAMLLVVILGYFATTQEVGVYSAVEKIMRVSCYALLMPALQVCYPQISKMNKDDSNAAIRFVRWLSVAIITTMLIIGCVLFFYGVDIMHWLGKDYSGAEEVFRIMAFIPVFVAISGIYGQLDLLAIGQEKQKRQFRNVYIIGAGLAMGLVLVTIPNLTATKTAYILLITEAVVAIGMGLFAFMRKKA